MAVAAAAMNVRGAEAVAVLQAPPPPAGHHPGSQDDARVAYLYQRSGDPDYQASGVRWSTGDDSAIGVSRPRAGQAVSGPPCLQIAVITSLGTK